MNDKLRLGEELRFEMSVSVAVIDIDWLAVKVGLAEEVRFSGHSPLEESQEVGKYPFSGTGHLKS